jgi:hypothetical protein
MECPQYSQRLELIAFMTKSVIKNNADSTVFSSR